MTPLRRISTCLVTLVAVLMLAAPALGAEAGGEGETAVDPIAEFALEPIGPSLDLGPVDMTLNKAVLYLWAAVLICCGWAVWQARRMRLKPDGKQTFTETMYTFAHDQIAKATLGDKVFSRYMPYVASLFMFLWVVNIISFLPLPQFGGHSCDIGVGEVPCVGLYAATSNLNVTLALTLVTWLATHWEGLRNNGPVKYLGSWAPPDGNIFLRGFIWVLHGLGVVLRLVSLSVRLFANMLAGHLLIIMMLALIIITAATIDGSGQFVVAGIGAGIALLATWRKRVILAGYFWAVTALTVVGIALGSTPVIAFGTVPIALIFFLFEVGLVASLQAFIFAMLSGIYIEEAAEPAH